MDGQYRSRVQPDIIGWRDRLAVERERKRRGRQEFEPDEKLVSCDSHWLGMRELYEIQKRFIVDGIASKPNRIRHFAYECEAARSTAATDFDWRAAFQITRAIIGEID